MKSADIIQALQTKLSVPSGRHLYGVLGSYAALDRFAKDLRQAKDPDGKQFPKPVSVNAGILKEFPDDEFRHLVENEAKRPEPTAGNVHEAFERFLRSILQRKGLVVLSNLELLFAYRVDMGLLRALPTDENRVLLLLPGKRSSGDVVMYPELENASTTLTTNLLANDRLWELTE